MTTAEDDWEFWPGSRRRRRDYQDPAVQASVRPDPWRELLPIRWDREDKPRTRYGGEDVTIDGGVLQRFWYISTLAFLLDRRPGTVRDLINDGVLPEPLVIGEGNGARRIFSVEQLHGLHEAARRNGLLGSGHRKHITETDFREDAHKVWRDLRMPCCDDPAHG